MVSGKVTVKIQPAFIFARPEPCANRQCSLNHLLHSTTEMEIQQMQRAS